MNSKVQALLVLMCVSAFTIRETEAVFFTVGGLLIDSALAFAIFNQFMLLPFWGKRSIESDKPRPEDYLSMATSMDGDKCLPVAVCAAMARGRDLSRNKFEDLVVRTFERKLEEEAVDQADRMSPLSFYLRAARFGKTARLTDACRQVSPSCRYSIDQLREVTSLVSKYEL